jgi:hypothetical protein
MSGIVQIEIEKFDGGGYRSTVSAGDTKTTTGCTTLPEIVGWIALHAREVFGESPYVPPPREPYPRNAQADLDVAADPELDGARAPARQFAFNGGSSSRIGLVAFLWCTVASLSMGVSWVA